MPTALTHGLPVLLVIALIALIYSRGRKDQPSYHLSQPFTHEPILWAATDGRFRAEATTATAGRP